MRFSEIGNRIWTPVGGRGHKKEKGMRKRKKEFQNSFSGVGKKENRISKCEKGIPFSFFLLENRNSHLGASQNDIP